MSEYNIFNIKSAFEIELGGFTFRGRFPLGALEVLVEQDVVRHFRACGTDPEAVTDASRGFMYMAMMLNRAITGYPEDWPDVKPEQPKRDPFDPAWEPPFRWELFENVVFTMDLFAEYEKKRGPFEGLLKKNIEPEERAEAPDGGKSSEAPAAQGIPRPSAARVR